MYKNIRPYIFRLEPERAHEHTLNALSCAGRFFVTRKLLDYYESTGKVEKDKIEETRKFLPYFPQWLCASVVQKMFNPLLTITK